MAKTTATGQPPHETDVDPVALFEWARAGMAEGTKDMTDAEREEVAECWANEIKARVRARIERGEPA